MHQELLRIKVHREQNALQVLRSQQRRFTQQAALVQQVRNESQQFQEQRILREQQWFVEIKGRVVKSSVIENMNQRVTALREQQALLEARVLDQEKRLQEILKELEQAQFQHQKAVREREKFDQFAAIQQALLRHEQALREEVELEEIASAAHQSRQGGFNGY